MIDLNLINSLFWQHGAQEEKPLREDLASELEWVEGISSYHTMNPNDRHDLYDEVQARAYNLLIHFDSNADIKETIAKRRPTESEASANYRNEAWEAVSVGWLQKPLTFVQKIFNKKLSNVSFGSVETVSIREGESLREYLTKGLPKYKSLEYFSRNILIKALAKDPEGWIAVHSIAPQSFLDSNDLTKPIPSYIPSSSIVDYNDDYVIVMTNERTELAGEDFSGCVYWVFTKDATYKSSQYGKKEESTFFAEVIDFHGEGALPIRQLGGIPRLDEENFLTEDSKQAYDSYFQPAIPFLNKYVNMASDIDAIFALHMFLQKIEIETPCNRCDGKGSIHIESHNQTVKCDACNGTCVDKTSLFDTYGVKPEIFDKLEKLPDMAKYIEVPTNIVETAIKREREYLSSAFKVLNMDFLIREEKIAAESEGSKRMDRESLYTMLENFSADVFMSMQFMSDWINVIRYKSVLGSNTDANRAIYTAPDRFEVETEADMTAQLKELSSIENAPSEYIGNIYIQAAKNRFGEESNEFKTIQASILIDPLFAMDQGTIIALEQTGKVSPEDSYIHFNLSNLIAKAIETDEGFLSDTLENQKELIQILVPDFAITEQV